MHMPKAGITSPYFWLHAAANGTSQPRPTLSRAYIPIDKESLVLLKGHHRLKLNPIIFYNFITWPANGPAAESDPSSPPLKSARKLELSALSAHVNTSDPGNSPSVPLSDGLDSSVPDLPSTFPSVVLRGSLILAP